MPEVAFKTMWSELKQGKSWMGLVKNRCKNGDYYWVDDYVTPVTEQGKVIGYESVRSVPSEHVLNAFTPKLAKVKVNLTFASILTMQHLPL